MSGPRIVADGLWRCLCPSIDTPALARALRTPYPSRPRTAQGGAVGRLSLRCQTRAQHSDVSTTPNPLHRIASQDRWSDGENTESQGHSSITEDPIESPPPTHEYDLVFRTEAPTETPEPVVADDPIPPTLPPAKYGPIDESISEAQLLEGAYRQRLLAAPTPVIYEALFTLRRRRTSLMKVKEFVKHLVEDRGEKLNSKLFEALVVANWDTAGTGVELARIDYDLNQSRIRKNYNSFIQALAIHPNYILRNQLLREMKGRWAESSGETRCNIALGLLRDKQYELAYDKLDELLRDRIQLRPWQFDIFIYTFTHLGFIDEAVSIVQKQRSIVPTGVDGVSLNALHFLLDEGSRALCYEATKYVWNEVVDTNILNPSDGTTLNALNTFSRHGDAELATKAIQHLSSRGVKLGLHHYEALVDCYSTNEDMENAIQVLCIMGSAGLPLDRSTTRSIYLLLKRSATLANAAVGALVHLSQKHEIPIAAFNVVVEALCDKGDTPRAINLYHNVRQLCGTGPNLETFERLLAGHPKAEVIDFLLSEMSAFSIELTDAMRDDLVCSYAKDDNSNIEEAFRMVRDIEDRAFKLGNHGKWISKPALLALVERCFKDEDPRVWHVVDGARLRSLDTDEDIRKLSIKWDPALSPESSGAEGRG